MGQVWLGTLLMPFNQSRGDDSGVSNIAMTLPPEDGYSLYYRDDIAK